MQPDDLRSSYDAVAEAYAQRFFDELSRKPFDRALLDDFAAALPAPTALDVGCGPGHVGGYLKERGLDVTGVDLSPTMIKLARRLNPGIRFEVADMRSLTAADASVGGIVAFYSVIHIPREEVPAVLREFRRVLMPAGRLLMSVHGGSGTITTQEFLGKHVPFEATLFEKDELVDLITASGLEVTHATVRAPYEFESQTPRLYVGATAA
jgi:SAM-dependent methyltransferase